MTAGHPEPIRIAFVDDNAGLRDLFRRVLSRTPDLADAEVIDGGDGTDAVRLRFDSPAPDILVVNGLMPTMNGVIAVREIRRREVEEGIAAVPIVFTSASSSMAVDAMVHGADGDLTRMPSPRWEMAVIRCLLGMPPTDTGWPHKGPQPDDAAALEAIIDRYRGRIEPRVLLRWFCMPRTPRQPDSPREELLDGMSLHRILRWADEAFDPAVAVDAVTRLPVVGPGRLLIAVVDSSEERPQELAALLAKHMPEALVAGTDGDPLELAFGDPRPQLLYIDAPYRKGHRIEAIAEIRAREQAEGLEAMPIVVPNRDGGQYDHAIRSGADGIVASPPTDWTAAALRFLLNLPPLEPDDPVARVFGEIAPVLARSMSRRDVLRWFCSASFTLRARSPLEVAQGGDGAAAGRLLAAAASGPDAPPAVDTDAMLDGIARFVVVDGSDRLRPLRAALRATRSEEVVETDEWGLDVRSTDLVLVEVGGQAMQGAYTIRTTSERFARSGAPMPRFVLVAPHWWFGRAMRPLSSLQVAVDSARHCGTPETPILLESEVLGLLLGLDPQPFLDAAAPQPAPPEP